MRSCLALALCLLPGLAPAQEFFTLKGHGGPIMDITVSPEGQIATASFDNSVGLWKDGAPFWLDGHAAAVNAVLFGHDALYSAGDDNTIRVWPDGSVIGRHQAKIVELAASPTAILSASWDTTIGRWPMDGKTLAPLTGHEAGVNALAVTRDGARLYSGSTDGTIRLWDLHTGQEKRQLVRHGFGVNEMVLNEPGGWLAYGAVDGVTRVIDLESGAQIADFTLDRRPVLAMTLSPEADRLAVGDGEGYILVIDTHAWRITRDFRATLTGPVWALAFSLDGQNIHAAGLDPALYSWPVTALDRHGPMQSETPSYLRDPDSMDNGERQFARKCSICHTLTPGTARRAGPTLYKLFGRKAGTVSDYRYSDILDGSDIVWDEKSIDALFDLGPDHYIPGSKMPMQRITNPDDRADLIAFLRRATNPTEDKK